MFMRLLFFMPSLRAGVFLPKRWKVSFQLSGSDAFCQKYIIFCRAKRYSVASLLTNLSTPARNKESSRICLCGCFLYALGEGGSFPPETLKSSFSTVREWRVLPKIYNFFRAKRYSIACSLQISNMFFSANRVTSSKQSLFFSDFFDVNIYR